MTPTSVGGTPHPRPTPDDGPRQAFRTDTRIRLTHVSATLKVTHDVEFGFEFRRGRFDVSLDGDVVGSLAINESLEIPIDPGHHSVRIRKGRYSSQDHSFDVADGEVVHFHCHGTRIWPLYVASIVAPNLAISLKRR
jgi:hypothetical protein